MWQDVLNKLHFEKTYENAYRWIRGWKSQGCNLKQEWIQEKRKERQGSQTIQTQMKVKSKNESKIKVKSKKVPMDKV